MKKLLFLAVAAIAVLSSCNNEDIIPNNDAQSFNFPTFTATIEGAATRTALNGNKVNWENGDEVLMMFASEDMENLGYYIYEATPGVDASTATLTCKTVLQDNPAADRLFNAMYPASLRTPESDVYFPETQVYAGDNKIGFAPMSSIFNIDYDNGTVKPTPEIIEFKNATALLKITVPYTEMTSVQNITVSSDLAMYGNAGFEMRTNTLYIDDALNPGVNDHLILDCYGGNENANVEIPADGSKIFYIAIPSPIFADGEKYAYLQIDVTDGTTTKSMRTNKAGGIQVERNKIYPITFAENYSPTPAFAYVDLGLSVKWATCNLGASAPEETGLYYQWGDTQGYGSDPNDGKVFRLDQYVHYNYSADMLSKYYSGDDKTVLDIEDDAARAALGGTWRIPTETEWTELINNCTLTWTTINGMNGMKFQSMKAGYTDKWIFLPATGWRDESTIYGVDVEGYYWSSNLNVSFKNLARVLLLNGTPTAECGASNRGLGQPIRPVCQ